MPPSALFRQYERLLADGFPADQLRRLLTVRMSPVYDMSVNGVLEEWIKSRGSELLVEKDINKGGRLAEALRHYEREWVTWRKVQTIQRLEQEGTAKTKLLRLVLLFTGVFVIALILLVGAEEFRLRHWPRLLAFAQQTMSRSKSTAQQQQDSSKNSKNKNDKHGNQEQQQHQATSSTTPNFFLPLPPTGHLSWFTWASKQLGVRETLQRMRGTLASAEPVVAVPGNKKPSAATASTTCSCGDYVGAISESKFTAASSSSTSSTPSGGPSEEDDPTATTGQQHETAMQEDAAEQQQHQQQTHHQQDDDHSAASSAGDSDDHDAILEPTDAGRRFLGRASTILRKASGTFHTENAGRAAETHADTQPSSSDGVQQQQMHRGVLQPAFLLEGSDSSYAAHVSWLAHRFDPPLQVVELFWEDIADAEHLADFLYWNTGWRSTGGCCVILSLPSAIAPIARVRNVTRSSALPLLVERLTSLSSAEAREVQQNVGCKALVVARADPTTAEIRSKQTYKRMRNLFASFIL